MCLYLLVEYKDDSLASTLQYSLVVVVPSFVLLGLVWIGYRAKKGYCTGRERHHRHRGSYRDSFSGKNFISQLFEMTDRILFGPFEQIFSRKQWISNVDIFFLCYLCTFWIWPKGRKTCMHGLLSPLLKSTTQQNSFSISHLLGTVTV